jgi:hypothetical protein
MDILIGLYNHLSNDEKIKKIVGNKIYPVILPQNIVLPAIVYSSVLANYDSALQGDTGFVRQTIQIVSHAKTYKEARELSRLIKKIIQNLHGNMGGVFIEAVFIKTDYELNTNTSLKFDTEEYMCSIEFEFYYIENKEVK